MLQPTGRTGELVKKLDLILLQNTEMSEKLDVFNRRFVAFERSVTINSRHIQETKTLVNRIKPYIEKAMAALHQAFKMVCNGILNQREEISEFAGTVLDTSRVHIV